MVWETASLEIHHITVPKKICNQETCCLHTSLSTFFFLGKTSLVQVSHGGHVAPKDRGLAGGAAVLEHEEPHIVNLMQATSPGLMSCLKRAYMNDHISTSSVPIDIIFNMKGIYIEPRFPCYTVAKPLKPLVHVQEALGRLLHQP